MSSLIFSVYCFTFSPSVSQSLIVNEVLRFILVFFYTLLVRYRKFRLCYLLFDFVFVKKKQAEGQKKRKTKRNNNGKEKLGGRLSTIFDCGALLPLYLFRLCLFSRLRLPLPLLLLTPKGDPFRGRKSRRRGPKGKAKKAPIKDWGGGQRGGKKTKQKKDLILGFLLIVTLLPLFFQKRGTGRPEKNQSTVVYCFFVSPGRERKKNKILFEIIN